MGAGWLKTRYFRSKVKSGGEYVRCWELCEVLWRYKISRRVDRGERVFRKNHRVPDEVRQSIASMCRNVDITKLK
jgi:hypothetical protein